MPLIVQHITVHWTQKSRGGSEASRRNSVPEVFKLPVTRNPESPLLHTVTVREASGFESPDQETSPLGAGPHYRIACADIRLDGDGALLTYSPTAKLSGAPARPQFPRDVGRIGNGQWARLVYNGRFAEEAGWRYQKVVINAGLFDPAAADSFFATGPAEELRDLAKLL